MAFMAVPETWTPRPGARRSRNNAAKHGNIGTALAKGRQRNGDYVEAEIEILAESSFLVLGIEIAIGGGHDAHIHFDFLIAAYRTNFFFLEKTQEFGLHFERKFTDFIEKNRAGIGGLQADPALERSAPVKAPFS